MSLPEDSRPFTVLRQHADDFKSGFDDDIKSCLDLLDSKLSALIRDPLPAKTPPKDGSMLSVDIQFTRAKYDIYVNMKNLCEELESSWKEQLEEMKSSFLENVEILLAKTKLDKKFATNDAKNILKSRRGRNQSPTADTSLSTFSLLARAKQLQGSVLSALLPQQSNDASEDVEENGFSMDDVASKSRSPAHSPPSLKAPTKRTPSPKKIQVQEIDDTRLNSVMEQDSDDEKEEEVEVQEVVSTRSRRGKTRNSSLAKQTPTKKSTAVLTPQKRATRGRKSILKPDSLIESGANDAMECEVIEPEVVPRTPKNVHFSVGLDVNEDLEIYSPDINITRSAPRRKTVMMEVLPDNFADLNLTPNIVRVKSKRKTIGSIMDNVPVAPSPKRFKSSRNSSVNAIAEEAEGDDLSGGESSGASHYTPWVLLDDLDGKVPTQPGVYELKVYKAKKTAYIGSCDNLRHKLTLHKLAQNSGHKHLDKYLERNKKDIQVRYEIMASSAQAKDEEKKRVKSFVDQYRSTPSYN